jgi:hypothetical protein
MMIVAFGLLAIAIPSFIGSILLGLYLIPRAQPVYLMYVWDGLIVAFLFFCCRSSFTCPSRSTGRS